MSQLQSSIPYILGIDLGANSLGWSVVALVDDQPASVVDAGVRIFPEAVTNLESGKDEPKNAQRRKARQMRRQTERRARRIATCFRVLQSAGLLPPFSQDQDPNSPLSRDALLKVLDRELESSIPGLIDPLNPHASRSVLLYRLRALALDQDLPPFAVGRIFLHIAQRRGFKSGRINSTLNKTDDQELGQVAKTIQGIQHALDSRQARTVGEYWAHIDPHRTPIRGIGNWSSRQMHIDEFEILWQRQSRHLPQLTPVLHRILHRRIFFQRPLKSAAGLIGSCEFKPGRRRAPIAHLLFQRFRLLQAVNDLRVATTSGEPRSLTAEQRHRVLDLLETTQTVKFTALAKKIGLAKGEKFTHEAADRDELKGNVTACKLRSVFGPSWDALSDSLRNAIVGDVRSIDDKSVLARLAETRWGLDREQAARLCDQHLEPGYGRLSLAAIRELLPLMEQGVPYMTAVSQVFPNRLRTGVHDLLPPVEQLRVVRNPAVVRSLTELRKVVNALLRQYGPPERIHVELARELKKTKRAREASWKEMRQKEAARKRAAAEILAKCGLGAPSREDIDKVLLWQECRGCCPYTGEAIGFCDLIGRDAKWEIEHIIPYSRSLNDSLANKTLCRRDVNRRKGNQTPWEAFGQTPEWSQMVERVQRFDGDRSAVNEKFVRFTMQAGADALLAEFTSRQLNDTKYASRLAAEYLGLLYGGVSDEAHIQRVFTFAGGITAQLRKGWGLHSILRDGPRQDNPVKPRDDHRHHAIDATVIALANPKAVRDLSAAAAQARLDHRRGHRLQDPFPQFLDNLRAVIANIRVSHRSDRRLRGAFHAESVYSPLRPVPGSSQPAARIRCQLHLLTANKVEAIADSTIREIVQARLTQLGQPDPSKAFKDPVNLPFLPNRHGQPTVIRRVRLLETGSSFAIGNPESPRLVKSSDNHHLAVYSRTRGSAHQWEARAVSLFEALQRLRSSRPVVAPQLDSGEELIRVFHKGDMVEMNLPADPSGPRALYVVRTFSIGLRNDFEFVCVPHYAAGQIKDLKATGQWIRIRNFRDLQKANPVVIAISPIGKTLAHASIQSN